MTIARTRPTDATSIRESARQALLLMLAALLPALLAAILTRPDWRKVLPAADELTIEDALARTPPVLWIDARPSADYAKAHIPGALPLNEDEWSRLVPEVLNRWSPRRTVVVYCNSETCDASERVARRLREAGISPVFTLHGGWEAWTKR